MVVDLTATSKSFLHVALQALGIMGFMALYCMNTFVRLAVVGLCDRGLGRR